MKALIIEDEKHIADTLREQLRPHYVVECAFTAKQGIHLARVTEYDVILLDLGLPDMPGEQACIQLRQSGVKTPILVLTARGTTEDKVTALDVGADDYVTKPFKSAELLARMRALLRRSAHPLTTNQIAVDGLILDTAARTVTRDNQTIALRRKEFDLLEYLMRNAGRVMTRDMILEHVWDGTVDPFTNAIDVHIKYLRDRIDRPFSKKLIHTVHGLGYKIQT